MELRERHTTRPIDFSSDCVSTGAGSENLGVRTSTLPRRALLCFVLAVTLAIPIPGLAADEDPTTTTIPDSTTTTSSTVDETTTTADSTTTTIVGSTTTIETSTTTIDGEGEPVDVDDPATGEADPVGEDDPLVEDPLNGENPTDGEELPLPSIRFPIVGRTAYRSTYGEPRDGGARLHNGTDIFAEKGAPVVAVASGRVERMGISEDAGLFVVLRHNDGWRSVYVHLNNDSPGTDNGLTMGFGPAIDVGVRVRAGTLLGYVGDSGNAEESTPHLHFELHQPDRFRPDPYPALRAARRFRNPIVLPTVSYRQVETVNADLVAHVDPGSGFNAGLAVVDGHAYIGTWGNHERCPGTGIRIFDISDASEPAMVGTIADHREFPGTATSSVWVGHIESDAHAGRIGLVGLADCNDPLTETEPHPVGLAVYDLDDPAEPRLMEVHEIEGAGVTDFAVDVSADTLRIAAVVPVVRANTPGIHETLTLFELSDIATLQHIATWSPDVITGTYAPSTDADALLSGGSVSWLDQTTISARLRSFGELVIDVTDPGAPLDITPPVVQWTFPDEDTLSGEPPSTGYDSVNDTLDLGLMGTLEAQLSGGAVLIRDTGSSGGSEVARMVSGPAFDPQHWWLAPDGGDEFPFVWDVALADGLVYFTDMHSGLWIFELAPELVRTSTRSAVD